MKKSWLLVSIISLLLIKAGYTQPVLSLTPVITNLSAPMQLVNAGDGTNRIFIIQKDGAILLYNKAYVLLGNFLTLTGITSTGERGLLSMAFHPDYANNGFFYVYYTNSNGDLELARYKVSNNANQADASSKVVVITIPHSINSNHNGGTLRFGSEGYLYLSTGDGGGGGDVPNNAQNTNILLGKILRLAVNTSVTPPYYNIPSDNPFANEVFAYGLRNPFRWNFDNLTHDIWIGDVGQDSFEEINFRKSDSINGTNFGWRCFEGNNNFNLTVGCSAPINKYTFPIYSYPTQNPAAAITGGSVYRGDTYIGMYGYYISADFYSGTFYKILYNSVLHTFTTTTQLLTPAGIADFDQAEDGELYAVSLNTGTIYRLISNGPIRYTFTGNGNWDLADNWSNGSIPPSTLSAGSAIIINPAGNGECLLNVQQIIASGASIIVKENKKLKMTGNLSIQ